MRNAVFPERPAGRRRFGGQNECRNFGDASDWTRVRNGADEGWVPTTSVDAAGTSAGGAGPFDENTFADLCVLHSLTYDVNPIIVSALRNFALA